MRGTPINHMIIAGIASSRGYAYMLTLEHVISPEP